MADTHKANDIQERIRQALENLGGALDEWLNQRRRAAQPIPVPVDRPLQRRKRNY